MPEPTFDHRLRALFAEPVAAGDTEIFARLVETRLRRAWALRRLVIVLAGAAGGLVAAAQLIGSGFLTRLVSAARWLQAAGVGVRHLPWATQPSFLADPALRGEVGWLALGLAVFAAALWAGRSLEDR